MTYKIDWEKHGTYVECSGAFDMAALREANGRLHGYPEFDDHRYQIWNLLDADLSGITRPEMVQPAAIDKVAERSAPHMRVALVVQDAYAARLCDAYIESAGALKSAWQCRRFEDVASARQWAQA